MLKISVEKTIDSKINILPMSIKRNWMEETSEKHAYRCFPVTQANMIGWSLSCSKDIRFIWNGINNQSGDNVQILEGNDFCYTGRGQSTLSFNTGVIFKTEENISLFTINPVNYFSDDFETMASLMSTSFYDNPIPLAIKARSANKEILIKAGTPLATIIPISLTSIDNTSIEINKYKDKNRRRERRTFSYGEAAQEINKEGKWTDWYRDAVNEKGESLGKHEVKALRLSVTDNASSDDNGII
jgi:hypothetical protein